MRHRKPLQFLICLEMRHRKLLALTLLVPILEHITFMLMLTLARYILKVIVSMLT